MKATLHLGRIAGVAVGLHWSVLGIVVLLVVIVAGGLAAAYPEEPLAAHVVAGLAAAVLFGASLLAHELMHAVVARRNGVGVDDITLWLLGGVAKLRGDAPSPGADFRIAAVGPAASLVAALVFGVLTWAAAAIGVAAPWVQVLFYLAAINVLLAVFNLVPAAPLDGGRILRAALWAWRGDRGAATVWAARAGRVFGFALVAFGILWFVAGYGAGLWWVLLGFFISVMAGAEEAQARTGAALEGLSIRDVMTAEPDTADGDATVARFLQETALVRRHSAFPLVDGAGRPTGLVTLGRLKSVPAAERERTTLARIACPVEEIPFARPEEPLTDLLPRMHGCSDGRALVLDGERLAGIVSPSDISRAVSWHGIEVGGPASRA